MKKLLSVVFFSALILMMFSFPACATAEYNFEELQNELSDDFSHILTNEIKDAFDSLGINELDFESVYNVSFKELLTYFTPEIKVKAIRVFSSFFELFSTVLILSAFSVLTRESGMNNTLMLFGSAIIILLTFSNIANTINSCLSVLKLSNGFVISYVPIFTLIVSFSGNPASALVYNSFVLGFTEIISAVINGGLVDFIGCFLCLAVAFSFNESLNTSKLINAVNKTANFVLSISASLFSGVLTVKNIMAVSLDGVSVKGIRFLLSSFIPIVGASISEAYSSVLGSINLIKSSVAVVGILGVVIINLPVIIEVLMYYVSFSALSYISEISSCNQVSDLFRAICSAVRLMLILLVFQMFILIISTGIILSASKGV